MYIIARTIQKQILKLCTMFDVFFITNNEPQATNNFLRLLLFNANAKRIDSNQGIHHAHKLCAEQSTTDHFFVVDSDNWLLDYFLFPRFMKPESDGVYVWRCRNVVNNLVYGNGGIKLFPKKLFIDLDVNSVDMTTSLGNYHIVKEIASETRFNTSQYDAWRSAFRECCKLSSKIIKNQNDVETAERLHIWRTQGLLAPYGIWSIQGANDGYHYGNQHQNDPDQLIKINDFNWLKETFDDKYQTWR